MNCARRFRPGRSGFTLTEVLVVVVLVGIAGAAIAFGFQNLMKSNAMIEGRLERAREARAALETFAGDVRTAKAVLAVKPEKVSLWADDANGDGTASLSEIVNFTFVPEAEGMRAPWVRESWNSRTELLTLTDLKVAADTSPPESRHIVVHLTVGDKSDPAWVGTSILKREAYRAPEP